MCEQLNLFDLDKDFRIERLRQAIRFQTASDPLWKFTIKSILQCEKDFKVIGKEALRIQDEIFEEKSMAHDKMVEAQYIKV